MKKVEVKSSTNFTIAEDILNNKIIVIPTDTCYGIVGMLSDKNNLTSINAIKKRNLMTKIPVLFTHFEQIPNVNIMKYKKYFMPFVSVIIDNVAYRRIYKEKSNNIYEIIKYSGPIFASSFNIHNKTIICDILKVSEDLFPNIHKFYYLNNYTNKKSSKIIKIENDKIIIIRNNE